MEQNTSHTLDLQAGYHHIPLHELSIPKTPFISPFGKYQYIKVPFGLMQPPACFQELMTGVLKDFSFAITYLDDIIIFRRMAEEHLSHIKQIFEKLRNAHLLLKLSKCHFFPKEIQYLRHILSTKRHQTSTNSKTQAINNISTKKQLNKYVHSLGFIGYYRKFIKNFAKMAKPLTLLTCQKANFEWTPICHTAFLMLKESVTQALSYAIQIQQNDT